MVTIKDMPNDAVLPGCITNIKDVIGKASKSGIISDEQILSSRLVDVGKDTSTDTLAFRLTPGMRAVTVDVSESEGVAGMLRPGNTVDLLASYAITQTTNTDAEQKEEEVQLTKIIAENVQILAVNQSMSKDGIKSDDGKTTQAYSTVTLQVSPDDALNIIWVKKNGSLTFVLRSPLDSQDVTTDSVNKDSISAVAAVPETTAAKTADSTAAQAQTKAAETAPVQTAAAETAPAKTNA